MTIIHSTSNDCIWLTLKAKQSIYLTNKLSKINFPGGKNELHYKGSSKKFISYSERVPLWHLQL